jgi:dCTP deaminase
VILSDGSLTHQLDPDRPGVNRRMFIEPRPLPADIQPASIDLHLDDMVRMTPSLHEQSLTAASGLVMQQYMRPVDHWGKDWRDLHIHSMIVDPLPHMFVLASTVEKVTVPTCMVGVLDGKSTLARKGLKIHNTAGYIDPGFEGQITLEMTLVGPFRVRLKAGMKIGQLRFHLLDQPAVRPYGHIDRDSHYQHQAGPTPAAY